MKSSNNYVNKNQIEKHGWTICSQIPAIFFAKVGAAILLDRKRLVLEPCLCDNNTMLYCQNKDSWDPFFCLSLFETIKLSSLSQIGTLPSYNGSAVEKLYIKIPSLPEQRAIATYFRHIDSLIETADKKLASLKQVKEASLQSMFPKEGQKVPEVRFKGFEGEWKNCILSDIATFSKGHGYSKNDLTNEKDATPIILYGRMYTKYESIITRVETFANLHPNSVLSEGNEVIVPGSGETAEDISVASAICTKGIIIGGDLNILKPKEGIFAPFLALNITYSHAHYELSTKAQGKTIVHLHNNDFKDVHVSCPSLPEQRKIASFFVHLDKQIAIAQQRLDLLRRIKSACLDEMFV